MDITNIYYVHPYMDAEIDKLDGVESFCYQNCQRILLQAQGIQEGILYINATLSLRFDKEQKKLLFGDRVRSLLSMFDKGVTRTYYDKDTDSTEVFKQNLKYMQENNTPIIVGVDTFYMPYATNYGKNHARHTLLLCGYDSAEDVVYIIDWYPNWYYKGTVSRELFLLARASENKNDGSMFSGGAILNNWAEIHDVKQVPDENLLRILLKTVEKEYYHFEDDSNYFYGPEAIAAFKKTLEEFNSTEDYKSISKFIYLLVRRYRFFKQYLICFNQQKKKETILECVKILEREAEEWDKLYMLIVKASIVASEKVRERMLTRIECILECDATLRDCIERIDYILGGK